MLFLKRRASFRDYTGWDGLRLAVVDEVAMDPRLSQGQGQGLGLRWNRRILLLYVLGRGCVRLLDFGLAFNYRGNSKDLLGLLFG